MLSKIHKSIPDTQLQVYEMYPKLSWLLSSSRLLDSQQIEWLPFVGTKTHKLHEFSSFLDAASFSQCKNKDICKPSDIADSIHNEFIYVDNISGGHYITDAALHKGEVLWSETHLMNNNIIKANGNLTLTLKGFSLLHLNKYTGIIQIETIGQVVVAVRFKITHDLIETYGGVDFKKRVKKLYSRHSW